MAIASQGWFLTVDLVDYAGDTTTRRYELVATDTANDADAVFVAAASVLAALADVSSAGIKSYSVGKRFVETAIDYAALASADAEVSEHAVITAEIYQKPHKSATIDIPSPVDTVFLDTSGAAANIVDLENSDVLAYTGLFSQTGNVCYISDGEQIANGVGSRKGIRTHSKSRG